MNDTGMLGHLGHALAEAHALCDLMERRSELPSPAGTTLGQGSTLLDSGLALSPVEAALCARQPLRWIVFIRAVLAAIETQAAKARDPVRVLYAGCGPLAPLALPLMTILGPQRAVFTLLDIHAESPGHVRALVGDTLPAATVTAPSALAPRYAARLLTRIDAFGPHRLDDYESSLNLPQRLPGRPVLTGGDRLAFDYRLGSEPGLVCGVEKAPT